MPKTFPDHTVETAARAAGLNVTCLWQIPGPRHTAIAWLECLAIGQGIVIVETYKEGGWTALSDCRTNRVDETIADVLARCRPPSAAVNLQQAAQAIVRARDYHAAHGQFDPADFHPEPDQCFDDWAADILSTALAASD